MEAPGVTKHSSVYIEFSNISYTVSKSYSYWKKGEKNILQNISGKFPSGQLTAILGPSGCGKTSLMDILAGHRTKGVKGKVLINGAKRITSDFRKMSCYILQDVYLHEYLTVLESIWIAAHLKLGNLFTNNRKEEVINNVLTSLNMTYCKNTRAAKLSGGEKKRLCIALELVSNPPVMFFDEPTSGMDSRNSYQFVNLLKNLAQEGRTIICTIHQPSTKLFEKLDFLYAMASGQCIYRGHAKNLVAFMSSVDLHCPPYHNPADFLLDVASGEYGNAVSILTEIFEREAQTTEIYSGKSPLGENKDTSFEFSSVNNNRSDPNLVNSPDEDSSSCSSEDSKISHSYPCSLMSQFQILLKAEFRSIVRDWNLTHLRLIVLAVIGIVIGALYYQIGDKEDKIFYNSANLFFSIIFVMFSSMMSTVLSFPLAMKVFQKEHLNGWYSLTPYYLAKTLADLPFQIIYPLVYIIPIYFLSGQPSEWDRFGLFTLMCLLISLVGQSLGIAVGASMNLEAAVYVGPMSIIPAVLLSGFFISYSSMPRFIRWISYLSFLKYGFEGVMLAIYGNGRDMLSALLMILELGLDETTITYDIYMLLVFFMIFRITGFVILLLRIKRGR